MNERQALTARRWEARPRGDCKAKGLLGKCVAFWDLEGERFAIRGEGDQHSRLLGACGSAGSGGGVRDRNAGMAW